MKIYLAGPLFTLAEREWNESFAKWLKWSAERIAIEVVLPQDDCADCFNVEADEGPVWPCVYMKCIEGVTSADVVVAVLDGADSDSGTCYEAGYAKALGKPVIGVRTDLRPTEDKGGNAMMAQGCDQIVVVGIDGSTQKLAVEVVRLIELLSEEQG